MYEVVLIKKIVLNELSNYFNGIIQRNYSTEFI